MICVEINGIKDKTAIVKIDDRYFIPVLATYKDDKLYPTFEKLSEELD